jgi:hypothetical protein
MSEKPTYTAIMRTLHGGLFTRCFAFTEDAEAKSYLEHMNAQAAKDEIFWSSETGLPSCNRSKNQRRNPNE